MRKHNAGKGAKYTRSRTPVELVALRSGMTKSEALKLEYRVKQSPTSKKITELEAGEDKMAMDLKKELKALQKEFKELGKKLDKLTKAVEKSLKSKPDKSVASKNKAPKAKAKPAKSKTVPKNKKK